jgi:hypothetical protein
VTFQDQKVNFSIGESALVLGSQSVPRARAQCLPHLLCCWVKRDYLMRVLTALDR